MQSGHHPAAGSRRQLETSCLSGAEQWEGNGQFMIHVGSTGPMRSIGFHRPFIRRLLRRLTVLEIVAHAPGLTPAAVVQQEVPEPIPVLALVPEVAPGSEIMPVPAIVVPIAVTIIVIGCESGHVPLVSPLARASAEGSGKCSEACERKQPHHCSF